MPTSILGRVLVVDDEVLLMEALVEALTAQGYVAKGLLNGLEAIEALQSEDFDLLLTDLMMPSMDGISLLRACMAIDPNLIGIVMTGQGTVPTAVEAMKTGAFDYVLKPFRLDVLLPVLARAREVQRLRLENIQLRESVAMYDLSQTISSLSLDSKLVLEKTTQAVLRQTDAEEVSIMLLQPESNDLLIARVDGRNREHLLHQQVTLGQGVAGWVAGQSEALILNGEVSDPRFAPIFPRSEIHSAISMPMRTAGKLVGVLNVNRLQARRSFTPGEVKALSILASAAAAAIENEALFHTLEAREKRFRALTENAPDGITVVDRNGMVTYTGPSVERILGYSQTEALGQHSLKFVHPEDRSELLKEIARLSRESNYVQVQYRFRHKDGSWRWLESTVSRLIDEPSTQGLVFNYRDITERTQAGEALRESERRFRNLFENTPVSIWEEDFSLVKGILNDLKETGVLQLESYLRKHPEVITECLGLVKLIDINQASLRLHGAIDKSELLSNLEKTFVPQSFETFVRELVAVANGEQRMELDVTLQTLSGQRREATMLWAVVPGHEETYGRVLVSLVDITERKRSEQEMREKERLLSEAQHIGQIGSWRYEIHKDTFQFSDEMYHLLDVPSHDFQHSLEGFLSILSASDRSKAAKWMDGLKAGKQMGELDVLLFGRTGELHYIRCRGAADYGYEGYPNRLIGTAQDITDRKLSELQIRQQLDYLRALRTIDEAITSSFNLHTMLDTILSQVISQLNVDAADVLLLEPQEASLTYISGKGFDTTDHETMQIPVEGSHVGRVITGRRLLNIPDLKEQPFQMSRQNVFNKEGFTSYFGVPLIAKGQVKGALELFHRLPFQPYPDWLDFLNTLAGQTAIAIDNANLFENLQRTNEELFQAYDATIEGWSRAMDLRDKETEGHTQRVTNLTLQLARTMGMSESELIQIRRGALLHDMGKLGVPDHILLKTGKLTDSEWEIMKKHPQFAFEMLASITYLKPALNIPYCHHEKWDGSGYPRGLKGEEIPLEARLFSIVDVWDAITSDRPYRKAWSQEEAVSYIQGESGKHFDPHVVSVFLQMMAQEAVS